MIRRWLRALLAGTRDRPDRTPRVTPARAAAAAAPRQTAMRATRPYHAVSVQPGPKACQQARSQRERRFLSREAPRLPLPGCDSAECRCSYQHHEDRRQQSRRASDVGVASSIAHHSGPEQRGLRRGRRTTD